MATNTDTTAQTLTHTPTPTITITAHHRIPIKLTAKTYSSWLANLLVVLNGFDLIGHIDDTKPCPSTNDPTYPSWFRQDQLILAAVFGSIAVKLLLLISSASNAAEAWHILGRMFADILTCKLKI